MDGPECLLVTMNTHIRSGVPVNTGIVYISNNVLDLTVE